MARITWNGDAIKARVAAASKLGIDKVQSLCVTDARQIHPWSNQTGFEEGSITMAGAVLEGARVVGRWGAYTNYSLALEIGTSRIGPTIYEREQAGGGDMWAIPAPKPDDGVRVEQAFTILPPGSMEGQEGWVTIQKPSMGEGPLMHSQPFLRPSADMNYPLLAGFIGRAYRGEEL